MRPSFHRFGRSFLPAVFNCTQFPAVLFIFNLRSLYQQQPTSDAPDAPDRHPTPTKSVSPAAMNAHFQPQCSVIRGTASGVTSAQSFGPELKIRVAVGGQHGRLHRSAS